MSSAQKARLRVLMLGPYPAKSDAIDGGVSAVVTYLSEALAARPEIELHGARVGAESPRNDTNSAFGFPVHDIPKSALGLVSSYRAQRRRMKELVDSVRPDIVHAQGADLPGYLAIHSGVPSVITVHGMIGEDARYKTQFSERIRATLTSWLIESPTVRKAGYLVLISPYVASYYGTRIRGQIFNIANPVSTRYFAVSRDSRPGRILYAGRVIPRKGVVELVKAVAMLPKRLQPKLVIAGALTDLAYVSAVRAAIVAASIEDRVELRGLLGEAELLREFATAQVLALPSFQETAPMVIQQAMASGIPVVASRICGVPFQVEEGRSGYLVEPGNVSELSSRLMEILDDPSLANRLGSRAQQVARNCYTASVVAEATAVAYRMMLSRAAS
jgi:glycosyltransferase involved in cell wall biosynthesis